MFFTYVLKLSPGNAPRPVKTNQSEPRGGSLSINLMYALLNELMVEQP